MGLTKKKKLSFLVSLLMTSTHWIIGCKKSFFDSQAFDKNSIRLPKRRYIHDIVSEFRDYETNGTFLTSLHENRGIQLNSFLFQNNNKVLMSHKENEEKNKLLITPMQCTAKHNLLNNIPNLLFVEMFQDDIFSRWFTLKHKKSQGKWSKGLKKLQDNTEDYGLQVSSSMQHHSIASHFKKPIVIKRDQVFILSFEIQYPSSYECGSSSITLYSKQTLTKWNVLSRVQIAKELPSSIQFAADICGNRLSLHWNLKRHNPFNNEWVEHHLSPAPTILKTQNVSTLYTLKVSPNDSFTVLVNHQVISQGTFHKNLVPPLESNEQPFLFLTKFDYLLTLATNHFNAFRVSPWFISLMQTTIFKLKTFLCRQQEIKHNPLLFLEKIIYLSHDMKILFNITKYAILLQIQKIQNFTLQSINILYSLEKKILNLLSNCTGYSNRFSFSSIQLDVWTLNGGAIFDNIIISNNEKSLYQFLLNTWIPLNSKTFFPNASSSTCQQV